MGNTQRSYVGRGIPPHRTVNNMAATVEAVMRERRRREIMSYDERAPRAYEKGSQA